MEQGEQMPAIHNANKSPLIIGGIVALILIVGAYLYFFTDMAKSPQVLMAERKTEMLEVVNNAGKVPLTDKQKTEILNTFGGSNTAGYDFTEAEREQILRALNGR